MSSFSNLDTSDEMNCLSAGLNRLDFVAIGLQSDDSLPKSVGGSMLAAAKLHTFSGGNFPSIGISNFEWRRRNSCPNIISVKRSDNTANLMFL